MHKLIQTRRPRHRVPTPPPLLHTPHTPQCDRSGLAGHPPPVVRWMDGDRILETSSAQHYSAQSPSERGEAVRVVDVTLHLPGLQREDNGRDIKCVASNTNLTQEKVRVVTIDMYCKC